MGTNSRNQSCSKELRLDQAMPVFAVLWRRQGEGTDSIRERDMASDSASPLLEPGSS